MHCDTVIQLTDVKVRRVAANDTRGLTVVELVPYPSIELCKPSKTTQAYTFDEH
jgi:hypothetical protein